MDCKARIKKITEEVERQVSCWNHSTEITGPVCTTGTRMTLKLWPEDEICREK